MKQTGTIALIVAGAALIFGWAPAQGLLEPGNGLLTEPWRLVTSHFIHANWNHWVMNMAGLLACGWLFERHCGRHYAGLLAAGVVLTSVGLVLWSPLSAYAGLSGALNALFVGGCLVRFAHERRQTPDSRWQWMWLSMIVLDMAKIGIEGLHGTAIFSGSFVGSLSGNQWAPTPLAHAYGWCAGLVYGLFHALVHLRQPKLLTARYQRIPAIKLNAGISMPKRNRIKVQ